MLLLLSIGAFAIALGLFAFFFDRYMGVSDTGDVAATMSGIRKNTANPEGAKRSRSS